MTYPTLKSLSKPLGLLWVSCLIAAPACGKKEEPAAPSEPEAQAEPSEAPEAGAGEADTGEAKVDAGGGDEDAGGGILEGPTRKRPGDRVVRRPGRGEDGERPRLRPGERPSPVMPAVPGGEAGDPAAMAGDPLAPVAGGDPGSGDPVNPGNPASPPTPTNPPGPGVGGEPGAIPGNPSLPVEPNNPAFADGRPNPAGAPVEVAGPTPEADRVLPVGSVMEVLAGQKLSPAGPLPGIAVQPGYSSTHYAVAKGKSLGVSLQIWQDPARRESDDRYRRMRLQYPKAEDVSAMPPAKAFYSYFAGIQTLTFVDSVKRVVASVSCGEGVCNHDQLLTLARRVRDRL